MNSNSSFRLRLLLGSVLWTLGLLALAHMIFRAIVVRPHFVFTSADPIIIGLALLFAFSGLMAVRSGLIPFRRLRERLLDVREGRLQTGQGPTRTKCSP